MTLSDFYGRHFYVLEWFFVLLVGLGFSIWVYAGGGEDSVCDLLHGNRGAIYGAVASIAGAMLGFAITALSIVWPAMARPEFKLVRESEHYGTLWRIFWSAIRWLGAATLTSLIALVFDRDLPVPCDGCAHCNVTPLFVATVVAIIGSTARVSRVAWVMAKIMSVRPVSQ